MVYFSVAHDPTQWNRQGPDTGSQYRSLVLFASEEQKQIATDYIAQLDAAKVYSRPIVTKLEPFQAFYPAESYHQDFLKNNPSNPYIVYNDLPKLENLKKDFPKLYQPWQSKTLNGGPGARSPLCRKCPEAASSRPPPLLH